MRKRTLTTIKLRFSVPVSAPQSIPVLLGLGLASGCHKVTCYWAVVVLGILALSQGQSAGDDITSE